ncbi:MAG: FAD:protein FMN transferase [Actinobacteria bacterium]|nr:FAD:protein FMN transferase [Actinomycetota bacterium]
MNGKKACDEKSLGKKNRRDTLVVIAVVIVMAGLAVLLVILLNPGYTREPYQQEKYVLDTRVIIKAYGKNQSQVEGAVDAAFQELYRIDGLANRYDPQSEISRVNASAAAGPVVLSHDLWEMFAAGMELYEASGGLFDITVGPLVDVWDVKGRDERGDAPPTDEEIKLAMELVGSDKLVLDEAARSVYFTREGMIVDLGGLAKGYALDRAEEVLLSRGIESAIINMISTTLTSGDKPGSAGGPEWLLEILNPREGEPVAILKFPGRNYISTSGDYQRFFEFEGIRYHHIIDPRTGYPARGTMAVTVLGARNGAWADAMSTAAFIMGYPEGLDWVESLDGSQALMVDPEGIVHITPGMEPLLVNLLEKVEL